MAITRVVPALIQVANNVTSTTIGNTTSIPSLTFDASGVIIAASNTTVTVANTNITGNIISSQIEPNPVLNGNLNINSTGALTIPVGTTAQRPGTPATGMMRLNTDTGDVVEVYDGTAWVAVGDQTNFFSADFLVVAGGGGGGGASGPGGGRGGGGGGGYQELTSQTLNAGTTYTVTVGAGGAGGPATDTSGSQGSNSIFNTTTSTGGGFGSSTILLLTSNATETMLTTSSSRFISLSLLSTSSSLLLSTTPTKHT